LVVEREGVVTAASVAGVGFTALVAEIRIFTIFFLVQEVGIFAIFVLVAEVSIFTIFVETFFAEQARADGIHGARQQFARQVDDDFLRGIVTRFYCEDDLVGSRKREEWSANDAH